MSGGMLQHMVFHKLSEQPLSGYGLCSEIERSMGHRPSYGSIYPLLDRLAKESLLSVKEEGRKKIYALTKKGREAYKQQQEERERLVGGLIANMKGLGALMGEDMEPLVALLGRLKRGEAPLGPVTSNMIRFRDLVIRMVQDGRAERNKKAINAMLRQMTRKLEAMR